MAAIRGRVVKRISLCGYRVCLMFSAYDVITGEELQIDSYRVDDGELIDVSPNEQPEASQEDGRYMYQIDIDNALKNCKLELYKQFYFPYKGRFMLNVTSVEDDATYIDIGRLRTSK